MKTHAQFRIAALLAGLLISAGAAAAAPLQSHISAVTVYMDRAVVTRTGVIELTAGQHELIFEGLPATLLDRALTVSGRGTAQATILDVEARTQWLDFTPNDRIRALEDELNGLQRQLRVLSDRATVLDRQLNMLVNIGNTATGPDNKETPSPRVSVEEWERLLAFSTGGFARIAADRQEVDFSVETTNEKVNFVRNQLGQLRGSGGKNVKHVVVRVAVEGAGRLALALSYTLPDACWTPTYDARFTFDTRKVALGYFGIVRQNTGEDWKDVDVTLSTARPSMGGAAPALNPWFLDLYQPVMLSQERRRQEGAAKLAYEATDAVMPPPSMSAQRVNEQEYDAAQTVASVVAGATSATFRIPVKATIPSDNAPHKVGIATIPLAADLAYAATPKLVAAAFLEAKVVNESEFPILAGPTAIFLDGTFIANGQVPTVMTGEKFDLALGTDDGIRIERKRINRFTEEIGLIQKETRVTYDVVITVTNNRKTTERITVRDQLPVSRHEKITVKLLAPPPRDVAQEPGGLLTWTLELKPGEKRELPLKISVTHPVDMPVSGME